MHPVIYIRAISMETVATVVAVVGFGPSAANDEELVSIHDVQSYIIQNS